MEDLNKKKEKESTAKVVDIENVNNTNVRLFDEAFISPNEEVQVLGQIVRIIINDVFNQNEALKTFYETVGLSEEKKLQVTPVLVEICICIHKTNCQIVLIFSSSDC